MKMIDGPLISVIVPIYKVEPWLCRCVDSIRGQTYENLEIILIDDGSPDHCGELCDEFAHEDNRIQVIHQQNKGLSAARNIGLDICKGDYIGFVDGDDFIHQEMYERLYADIANHKCNLAFCQPQLFYDDVSNFGLLSKQTVVVSAHDLIYKCLEKDIWFSAWTKLYHRSLFETIRYPEGRTNEDFPVTIPIYDRAGYIAVNYNKMYYYRKRPDSITTASFSIRNFDKLKSAEEVFIYIKEHHSEFEKLAEKHLISTAIGLLIDADSHSSEKIISKRTEVQQLIKKYYSQAKNNPYLSTSQKILLSAAKVGGFSYTLTSNVYRLLKLCASLY